MSIFFQFWWNLVKMTSSWLGQIAKISAWYYQKCGFFINDTFLIQSALAYLRLYVVVWRNRFLLRVDFSFYHTAAQCGKLRNFTATIFSQIFRQINVLLKTFTVNQFDEKKLRGSKFLVFPHCVTHTVEFTNFLYQGFLKNFRENNLFSSKEFYCRIDFTKLFSSDTKFS